VQQQREDAPLEWRAPSRTQAAFWSRLATKVFFRNGLVGIVTALAVVLAIAFELREDAAQLSHAPVVEVDSQIDLRKIELVDNPYPCRPFRPMDAMRLLAAGVAAAFEGEQQAVSRAASGCFRNPATMPATTCGPASPLP
jgi:hypothetical protein